MGSHCEIEEDEFDESKLFKIIQCERQPTSEDSKDSTGILNENLKDDSSSFPPAVSKLKIPDYIKLKDEDLVLDGDSLDELLDELTCDEEYSDSDSDDSSDSNHSSKRMYFCKFCWVDFRYRLRLKRHVFKVHTRENPPKFKCEPCETDFYTPRKFTEHFKKCEYFHLQKKIFICPDCDLKFPKEHSLKQHQEFHKVKLSYTCHLCGKVFKKQKILNHHLSMHKELQKPCKVCGRLFRKEKDLRLHIRTHDNIVPYLCLICKEGFTEKNLYKKHKKIVHKGKKSRNRIGTSVSSVPFPKHHNKGRGYCSINKNDNYESKVKKEFPYCPSHENNININEEKSFPDNSYNFQMKQDTKIGCDSPLFSNEHHNEHRKDFFITPAPNNNFVDNKTNIHVKPEFTYDFNSDLCIKNNNYYKEVKRNFQDSSTYNHNVNANLVQSDYVSNNEANVPIKEEFKPEFNKNSDFITSAEENKIFPNPLPLNHNLNQNSFKVNFYPNPNHYNNQSLNPSTPDHNYNQNYFYPSINHFNNQSFNPSAPDRNFNQNNFYPGNHFNNQSLNPSTFNHNYNQNNFYSGINHFNNQSFNPSAPDRNFNHNLSQNNLYPDQNFNINLGFVDNNYCSSEKLNIHNRPGFNNNFSVKPVADNMNPKYKTRYFSKRRNNYSFNRRNNSRDSFNNNNNLY